MKCFEVSGAEGGHRKCLLLLLLFRHKSQKGASDPWGQMSKFKFRSPGRWSSVLLDHLAPVTRELRLLEQGSSALAAPKNKKKGDFTKSQCSGHLYSFKSDFLWHQYFLKVLMHNLGPHLRPLNINRHFKSPRWSVQALTGEGSWGTSPFSGGS